MDFRAAQNEIAQANQLFAASPSGAIDSSKSPGCLWASIARLLEETPSFDFVEGRRFPLMGWTGRAPARRLRAQPIRGARAINRKATDSILTVIGIDIGKSTFHLVGLDQRGAIVMRY